MAEPKSRLSSNTRGSVGYSFCGFAAQRYETTVASERLRASSNVLGPYSYDESRVRDIRLLAPI